MRNSKKLKKKEEYNLPLELRHQCKKTLEAILYMSAKYDIPFDDVFHIYIYSLKASLRSLMDAKEQLQQEVFE